MSSCLLPHLRFRASPQSRNRCSPSCSVRSRAPLPGSLRSPLLPFSISSEQSASGTKTRQVVADCCDKRLLPLALLPGSCWAEAMIRYRLMRGA